MVTSTDCLITLIRKSQSKDTIYWGAKPGGNIIVAGYIMTGLLPLLIGCFIFHRSRI